MPHCYTIVACVTDGYGLMSLNEFLAFQLASENKSVGETECADGKYAFKRCRGCQFYAVGGRWERSFIYLRPTQLWSCLRHCRPTISIINPVNQHQLLLMVMQLRLDGTAVVVSRRSGLNLSSVEIPFSVIPTPIYIPGPPLPV